MDDGVKPKIPAPYTGPNVVGGLDEIFIQDAFTNDDERLWVPLAPDRWSRPLCLNVSQGYWVHLTKVKGGGLSKARGDTSNMIGSQGRAHTCLSHQVKSIRWLLMKIVTR